VSSYKHSIIRSTNRIYHQQFEDRVIFVDATLVPFLEKIAPLLETVECYVLLNALKILKRLYKIRCTMKIYLLSKDEYEWPVLNENDACGCVTPATTGLPKGVCIPSLYLFTCFQHNFS
jgi:hypothetical protein